MTIRLEYKKYSSGRKVLFPQSLCAVLDKEKKGPVGALSPGVG